GEWAQHYDLFRPDGITPLPEDEIPLARAFRGESVRDVGMAIKAKGQPVRLILANGSVIRGEAGQNLGAVVIMRDVTEFGRMEQELRNAKKELEKRVEERTEELRRTASDLNEAQRIAHLGSWELDLLTNKLSWSDEIYRIFEIDPAEFRASYEAFLEIVHPDDRAAVNAAFTDSVRSRHPYAIEHRLLFSDGRIKHLFEQCETYYAADDRPLRSIGTVQDITERKRAENAVHELNAGLEKRVGERTRELHKSQQALMNIVEDLNLKTEELEQANSRLQELERLKSMFIASMSHELRTPLNSIIGFSSILHDEWLGPVNPEQKENLNTIKRSGKHLLNLINDVIDVSKIETGRIEISFEDFDLYDVLTEAVQYVEKDIRDKGLELNLEISHHPIRTDKRRLLQCVVNLLSNAVKFTERGEIAVSFAKVDIARGAGQGGAFSPLIEISVKDTGIGIAEKDILRLYQPFVRLESHLRTTALGTGLGLYLTRKLAVEALHGDIVCTSTLGVGSTFVLNIPEQPEEHS
ncbi:MAG: histidine kinase dimerization/phospho-acceptor domain-containing protein, partial [Deltaproteobacteria bacterium]|nr:histidine kinase dimerization/phospho-acceptor domain-containing protein [Deltaproteobacteria bacterium]